MVVKKISLSLVGKTLFCDGDLVQGLCEVDVTPGHPVEGIVLKYRGQAKTHWLERKGSAQYPRFVYHTATQVYINTQTLLSSDQRVLQPGLHRLPFSFKLPSPLPTSFEGVIGYVRYWIEAGIPNSNVLLSAPTSKLKLNVIQLIDANLQVYQFPVSGEDSKGVQGCLCCASGPLYIEAKTDRAAYCSNEIISITGTFRNESTKKQAKPYAALVQRVVYKDSAMERNEGWEDRWKLESLGEATGAQSNYLSESGHGTWNGMRFRIPEVLPSIDCGIIQVRYEIEVGLDVPWALDLAIFLPIVIATVPFRAEPVRYPPLSTRTARWNGTGKSSSGYHPSTASDLPIMGPPDVSRGDYQPPSYLLTLLLGQVPQLDKEELGGGNTAGHGQVAPNPSLGNLGVQTSATVSQAPVASYPGQGGLGSMQSASMSQPPYPLLEGRSAPISQVSVSRYPNQGGYYSDQPPAPYTSMPYPIEVAYGAVPFGQISQGPLPQAPYRAPQMFYRSEMSSMQSQRLPAADVGDVDEYGTRV